MENTLNKRIVVSLYRQSYFYDAAYLYLATVEKAELWTADKKLSQAGKPIRIHLI